MKNFWTDNSKWLIPTITFIGGLLLGFYLSILRYESKVEIINTNIENIKDNIHDLGTIIQNKVLTK